MSSNRSAAGPAQTWVTFIATPEAISPLPANARISQYDITEVRAYKGDLPHDLQADWKLTRLETNERLPQPSAGLSFRGVVQHLNYTTEVERADLVARSRAELPGGEDTMAVMIPIAKSAAWWQLATDRRAAHFHGDAKHQGHTSIGVPYVDRIYRKLYHARFVDSPSKYDFLTYFEFPKSQRPAFEALLAELRNVEKNPEWGYVTEEFEIWMVKLA